MDSHEVPGAHVHLPFPFLPPIIGRDRELALAHALLLRDDVHLVNLRGPGGIGKTRLAQELTQRLVSTFDLVVFVELAPLREPTLILPAISSALHAPPHRPVLEGLIETIGERRVLLVLDNLEHLLPHVQDLTTLLAHAPHLKIVTTSRRVLHLRSEHDLPLAPLSLPQDDTEQSEAVQLFVRLAKTVDPTFELDDKNRALVERVCVLLDGMPLALELAAARLRAVPLEELVEWLGTPLEVLADGPTDAPRRSRSLRDTVGWSYDLLTPNEQEMFAVCGVFVGGFTKAALEAVTGRPDVRNFLIQLVEHSLLRSTTSLGGRWSMLEPIREFAHERLDESPDVRNVRERHANYYLTLSEQAESWTQTLKAEWMERFKAEHANFEGSLQWFIQEDRAEDATRLCKALRPYWLGRGLNRTAIAWIERVLATPSGRPRTTHRAELLGFAADHTVQLGDSYDSGERYCHESIELHREYGNALGEANVMCSLAWLYDGSGKGDAARDLRLDLLNRYEVLGDQAQVAMVLCNLGTGFIDAGKYDRALAYFDQALPELERLGDVTNLAFHAVFRAVVFKRTGNVDACLHEMKRSWQLGAAIEDRAFLWRALGIVAYLVRQSGQADFATRLLSAQEHVRLQMQRAMLPSRQKELEEEQQALRSILGQAAFEKAWRAGEKISLAKIQSQVDAWFAAPVAMRAKPEDQGMPDVLTSRERDVVALVAAGFSDKQVASKLGIRGGTVSKHVGNVLGKLELKNRTELARWAMTHGVSPSIT
ncbi:LuxR C-terminal-related transcriptional regulator [Deinococcus yavapaiensis]|uniref:Putative ATPase n=1 Tax=Deinococcus yavapaiensis KR-236 TaxID=694435 RepID=A0A318SIK6_9DEIO|nr:LuxR C-terminal-related transcriptional regulator [Deinococcus yavapaiensis]PYE53897.1 putative ATPase [Deinococcus yavapaiensis KR-236]